MWMTVRLFLLWFTLFRLNQGIKDGYRSFGAAATVWYEPGGGIVNPIGH